MVYVNYRSITVMTSEQVLEFALGLENRSYRFMWDIRLDLLKADVTVLLPKLILAIEAEGHKYQRRRRLWKRLCHSEPAVANLYRAKRKKSRLHHGGLLHGALLDLV